jgi:transcriptional activator of cad operon
MESSATKLLRIGEWCVDPISSQISRNGETARVEARTMRLLLCLADHAGEVVSIDELLRRVWPDVAVSSDSVYQAVTSLRRLLGDEPRQPTYIATVPRLGYRMVATVAPWTEPSTRELNISGPDEDNAASPTGALSDTHVHNGEQNAEQGPDASVMYRRSGGSSTRWVAIAALGVLVLALITVFRSHGNAAQKAAVPVATQTVSQPEKSIAVLPFLDLTQGMLQGEFADGMTEELIDKLSKISGLHVPGATSSFYFKDKQLPVAEIARSLGVVYVLDGSVRKSGERVRVAARLVRAENGYVIWTETYDRPFHDLLMVQDDIAGEVTKALKASIDGK